MTVFMYTRVNLVYKTLPGAPSGAISMKICKEAIGRFDGIAEDFLRNISLLWLQISIGDVYMGNTQAN